MFVLTLLEKIKGVRTNVSQGSGTIFKKLTSYVEARVKLTNT